MHRGELTTFTHESLETLRTCGSLVEAQVERFQPELVEIRRHLHAHPEPSGEELETSRYIADRLGALGLPSRVGLRGLGVVADLALGEPDEQTPLVAIRADIDALRLVDEKQVPYASTRSGVAHACGHDAHATMALGAAVAAHRVQQLRGNGRHLPGARLRFLFQPAEENSLGAQWLIDQGALEGVSAIVGLHVDPERTCGQVGIRYGVLTANCDEVQVQVEGKGGHAARPHHAADPIAAAVQLVSTLYQAVPRSVDARDATVLTIGQIAGGRAPNVIPERVEIRGSLRTTDLRAREQAKKRIEEVCRGIELATSTSIRLAFSNPLKGVKNDLRVASALERASEQVVGAENVFLIDRPSMGGEDFSVYLDHVPGAMLRLGCAVPGVYQPFLHSPLFDIDERALLFGTRILLQAAVLLCLELSPRSS